MITSPLTFCLNPEYLDDVATKYHEEYLQGNPFPHIVIDNFLPNNILEEILEEFPSPEQINWKKYDKAFEKKLGAASEIQMGEKTRFLLYQLNSSIFLNFIEKLTGVQQLIPDPFFDGAGLHQIQRGGFLKLHIDFNKHHKLPLDRRINLILYLNQDWKEEYGGALELWDQELQGCVKKIPPLFNRCVIFSTNDFTYHGHPEPLNCPEGITRKSIALFYYSNGRPPEEVNRNTHGSDFYTNSGELYRETNKKYQGRNLIKQFIPPIIVDIKNYISKKSTSQ